MRLLLATFTLLLSGISVIAGDAAMPSPTERFEKAEREVRQFHIERGHRDKIVEFHLSDLAKSAGAISACNHRDYLNEIAALSKRISIWAMPGIWNQISGKQRQLRQSLDRSSRLSYNIAKLKADCPSQEMLLVERGKYETLKATIESELSTALE